MLAGAVRGYWEFLLAAWNWLVLAEQLFWCVFGVRQAADN
jgi:hypothetical protein